MTDNIIQRSRRINSVTARESPAMLTTPPAAPAAAAHKEPSRQPLSAALPTAAVACLALVLVASSLLAAVSPAAALYRSYVLGAPVHTVSNAKQVV